MNAKELYIGCWYGFAGWSPNKEFILTKEQLQSDGFWRDYNKGLFYAIPLTEDWLLRFGCVKKGGSFLLDNIKLVCEDNNWKEPAIDVFYNTAYLTCIEYVHQLQNLYFCLTNTELTIHENTKEPKETT